MNIDEEMKELREAINIESHIALQLNTLLCKCNVCNAIGNLYIFLTIFKVSQQPPIWEPPSHHSMSGGDLAQD